MKPFYSTERLDNFAVYASSGKKCVSEAYIGDYTGTMVIPNKVVKKLWYVPSRGRIKLHFYRKCPHDDAVCFHVQRKNYLLSWYCGIAMRDTLMNLTLRLAMEKALPQGSSPVWVEVEIL